MMVEPDGKAIIPEKPMIAVTGASGFMGSHLVEFFRNRGYRVKAFSRQQPKEEKQGVVHGRFDLAVPMEKTDLAGCDFMIHCAHIKKQDHEDTDRLNLDGTRRLYELAKESGIKKFVFLSSLSAHDKAASHYGRVKLAIERLLNPGEDLILKPGLVLGNGGLFGSILRIIRNSWVLPLVDSGKQKIQYIDMEDLAQCLEAALENNITGNHPLVADEAFTLYDMAQAVRKRTGKRILFIPVPYWLANLIFFLFEIFHIPFSVGRENLLGLRQNVIWKTGDCLRVFGVKPRSYIETIDHLLE